MNVFKSLICRMFIKNIAYLHHFCAIESTGYFSQNLSAPPDSHLLTFANFEVFAKGLNKVIYFTIGYIFTDAKNRTNCQKSGERLQSC